MDITGIGSAVSSVVNFVSKWFPDKTQEQQNQFILEFTQLQGELNAQAAQTDIDKTEAGSASVFVAGWRPFIGWICGAGCAWNWIGISLVHTVAALFHYQVDLQPASISEMMGLLLPMLGLGSMRTIEKINGINSGH